MHKHLRIAVLSIIVSSLIILPGVSQGSQEESFSGRPSGNQQGPERPEMPQPTEAELSLLRLKALIDDAQAQPELAITADQANDILPILLDWDNAIASNPDAAPEPFVDAIASELTDAQKSFIPGPPQGMPGDDGGAGDRGTKGQRPPQGGPEKLEISALLTELIEALAI